jgi:hypothetical protein
MGLVGGKHWHVWVSVCSCPAWRTSCAVLPVLLAACGQDVTRALRPTVCRAVLSAAWLLLQILFTFLTILVMTMYYLSTRNIQNMNPSRKQGMTWLKVLLVSDNAAGARGGGVVVVVCWRRRFY